MGRKARDAAKRKVPQQQAVALADVPLAPELLADWGCAALRCHAVPKQLRRQRRATGGLTRRAPQG